MNCSSQTPRPQRVLVTSREEGMPFGTVFHVIGWTGFDQAVVNDHREGCLLVLNPADFVEARSPYVLEAKIVGIGQCPTCDGWGCSCAKEGL